MARRRKEEGEAVSLFPFLSILACVIGALTLMVMAVSVGSIDESESPEAEERMMDAAEIELDMELDLAELERLRQLMEEAKERLALLEAAKEELARLEKEREDATQDAGEFVDELAQIKRLRERIVDLKADIPNLDEQIAELEKQVEEAGKPKEAEVVVRPGGSGLDMEPTFVEVTANGVVVHDGKEPKIVRTGDLNRKDGRFHELLETVAATPKGIVIFLLREDGIGTYGRATYVARTHYGDDGYAKYGKLPIVGQGRIDLSQFRAE